MINKLFHLNCATLKPLSGKIICHCLLLDTDKGLILIDTGLGKKDINSPKSRLDLLFRKMVNPVLNINETAYHQIQQLGYHAEDVKFIILTHLHEDHIGGIDDFPNAILITSAVEYENTFHSKKVRFRPNLKQISGTYIWLKIELTNTKWNDFETGEIFKDDKDILLVDLKGHTDGHCGVLLYFNGHILLHCGDAYYDRKTIKYGTSKTPFQYQLLQAIVTANKKDRADTEKKLRTLYLKNNNKTEFFSSHDETEFLRMKNKQ
ncbi:MBL fold metallo-hydrolase [Ferruginibacter profundus]